MRWRTKQLREVDHVLVATVDHRPSALVQMPAEVDDGRPPAHRVFLPLPDVDVQVLPPKLSEEVRRSTAPHSRPDDGHSCPWERGDGTSGPIGREQPPEKREVRD